ncbi:putative serine/threonine-protein kinase PBL11 [Bidens hawaiensis]|uniref:putative serine/threonine-protein kinase PBL11 n=1 Tax=Bidens hawaiensis TaxID=980011 RepID=UPI00404B154C
MATRNFEHNLRLGGGEFGDVFEGRINYGEVFGRGFGTESFKHDTSSGYAVDNFLRIAVKRRPIPWKTRVQIAIQVAEALSFLHRTDNQVLNFSVRIHQILLDENFNAKIIDPLHYQAQQSQISKFEATVYSFGVFLIQMITGEPISEIRIADLRQNMWDPNGEHRKESLRRALDPCLHNADDDTTIMEAMKLALDCVANPYFSLMSALDILRQIETYMIKHDPSSQGSHHQNTQPFLRRPFPATFSGKFSGDGGNGVVAVDGGGFRKWVKM